MQRQQKIRDAIKNLYRRRSTLGNKVYSYDELQKMDEAEKRRYQRKIMDHEEKVDKMIKRA